MTKAELTEIQTLNRIIDSKIRQLDDMKKREYGVKTAVEDVTGVRGTKISTPTENSAVRILTLSESIDNDIDRLADMKSRAREAFRALDRREMLLMELRYMECLDWPKISKIT